MDRPQAGDTFARMLHAIDARDWNGVRREFADTVDIDYSSLFGEPPARVDADAQIAGWRRFAGAFDATQHITGPILVQPTAAGVIARTHVAGITLTVFYQEGNLNLPSMARARATPRGPDA